MGQPVVHFEVLGKNGEGEALFGFYRDMFDWEINTDNPVGYGIVDREQNLTADGIGIGGGVMASPMPDYEGHLTFYVEVPDVEAAMQKAVEIGGERLMGPDQVPEGPIIGQIRDVAGHVLGLTQAGTY